MSQSEAKRGKADDDAYELIYWPSIPGRGEFIRLLFEEAGVPYSDIAKKPDEAVSAVMGYISTDAVGDALNPPPLAPPILKHGDLVIHQTPTILLYVAPRLGLAPKEGNGVWHLNQIVLTILDGLSNEVHDTHHPIGVDLYYDDQKVEAKRRAKLFTDQRLPKFLGYIQRVLDSKTSGDGPWLYGGSLTYADLVLFQASHQLSHHGYALTKRLNSALTVPSLRFPRQWESSKSRANMTASSSCTKQSKRDPTSSST